MPINVVDRLAAAAVMTKQWKQARFGTCTLVRSRQPQYEGPRVRRQGTS